VNAEALALLIVRDRVATLEPRSGDRFDPLRSRALDLMSECADRVADEVVRRPVEVNLSQRVDRPERKS
jgi:hypothetical protein